MVMDSQLVTVEQFASTILSIQQAIASVTPLLPSN